MSENKPVYVVQHNHFDPIWRRCWDRPFDFKGKRYRSYADLEEYFINIWMESARKGASWSEGQAVVFRKYLERNPDSTREMQRLVAEKVIELTAAGETVPDTNMPSGETLLRNLVMGQFYFEDTFGIIPDVGWLEDAFGQSAQIPQIYRGCECRSVQKLSYKRVPGWYWRGLDGSVIFTGEPGPGSWCGGGIKIPPCPECNGVGCENCAYPGLSDQSHASDEEIWRTLEAHQAAEPYSMFFIGGEESVPNPRLPEIIEEAREKLGLNLVYGGFGVTNKYNSDAIAKIDDPDIEVSDEVEANPVSTGCYVTRIKIKQRFREVENLLVAAEKWATVGHLLGAEYPKDCLTEGWRDLLFVAFHDAITSTHINSAYYELLDMLDNAEHHAWHAVDTGLEAVESHINLEPGDGYVALYNAESWERTDPVRLTVNSEEGLPRLLNADGQEIEILDAAAYGDELDITFAAPNVPALGYSVIRLESGDAPLDAGEIQDGPGSIENEFFRIEASEKGIVSLRDKRSGWEVLDCSKYLGNELILEEDIGHPWGTMQIPSFEESLGQYTTSVKIRKARNASEIILTGQYKGSDANVKVLTWRQSCTIYKGVDRIDFRTEIDWDTAQRRIRVAFPSQFDTDRADYSIPYGALNRGSYEPDMRGYPSTNGDWPAINWVDIPGDSEKSGIALINTGTPSHAVKDGVLLMSLLRSPTDSWCLNEPEFYDCPDFDGARDAGQHVFTYSLIPHEGNYVSANIERRAREVNNPLIIRSLEQSGQDLGLEHGFISIDASDNIIVTAVKKAHRDDSVIVRLAETAGQEGQASVSIQGAGETASLVNYLERHSEPLDGPVTLAPFKVVTVKLSNDES